VKKHARHVDVHNGDHPFGGPSMLIAQQAAEADGILEVLDAAVGALGRGHIKEHHHHAGDGENQQ
jgi:hypothetical protein